MYVCLCTWAYVGVYICELLANFQDQTLKYKISKFEIYETFCSDSKNIFSVSMLGLVMYE